MGYVKATGRGSMPLPGLKLLKELLARGMLRVPAADDDKSRLKMTTGSRRCPVCRFATQRLGAGLLDVEAVIIPDKIFAHQA